MFHLDRYVESAGHAGTVWGYWRIQFAECLYIKITVDLRFSGLIEGTLSGTAESLISSRCTVAELVVVARKTVAAVVELAFTTMLYVYLLGYVFRQL